MNTDLELLGFTHFQQLNNFTKCILDWSKLLFTEQFSSDKSTQMLYSRIYFGWETCIIMWILGKSRRIGERKQKKKGYRQFLFIWQNTQEMVSGRKWRRLRKGVKERKGYLDSDFCWSVLIASGFFCGATHIIFMSGMSTECCGRRRWQLKDLWWVQICCHMQGREGW